MKKLGIFFVFLIGSNWAFGQSNPCKITLSCQIIDAGNGQSIKDVMVLLDESIAATTDQRGIANYTELCKQPYRVTLKHKDYEARTENILLTADTVLTIEMHHTHYPIDSVDVVGHSHARHSISSQKLTVERRTESQGKNLAEVLTDIAGVNILRTGSNIAKPVLNGLYGSRILLINNQVRHESQQWGMDHAPEIDPFAAQEVTVVKNADAVRYGPDALAGVILVNPSPIKSERLLSGSLHTVGQSNGRSGAVHAQIEGGMDKVAYRVGVTKKRAGDIRSADYYLGNTGLEELNFNGAFHYNSGKNAWEISYNHFGTTLGVFEGAHIGSKEDILARIAHGKPFEEYDFSYAIHSPKQEVTHDLAKISWQHKWHEHWDIESTYSIQRNHRKEFDLRRMQSDDTPMADMLLTTQALEVLLKSHETTLGFAGSLQVNNNTPGTGTTPIIPNFDNHTIGIFATQKYYWRRNVMELGLRYDYKYFDVAGYRYDYQRPNVDGTLNQYLLTDQKHFNNLSGIAGVSVAIKNDLYWKSHVGLAWRAPSANELYSDGIHHGTGTYEVGNPDLKSEKGIKWVNNLHFDSRWLIANVDVFLQSILDYSYAEPNPDSLRQTIRGTFPLFQYKQTNAFLYGADLSFTAMLHKRLEYAVNFSTVVGRNTTQGSYLPYIPSDRVQQSILYRLNKQAYVKLNHLFVAQQQRYKEGSDYASPPPAYHLFGVVGSYIVPVNKQQNLGFQVAVENLLNTAYKDYMDRFRYYAHLQGRNISLKLNYNF